MSLLLLERPLAAATADVVHREPLITPRFPRKQAGVMEVTQALVLTTLAAASMAPCALEVQKFPRPRAQQPVLHRAGPMQQAAAPFAPINFQNPVVLRRAQQPTHYWHGLGATAPAGTLPIGGVEQPSRVLAKAVQQPLQAASPLTLKQQPLAPGAANAPEKVYGKTAQQPDLVPNLLAKVVAVDPLLTQAKDWPNPLRAGPRQHLLETGVAAALKAQPRPPGSSDLTPPVLARKVQQPATHRPAPDAGAPVFAADPYLVRAKDWPNPTLKRYVQQPSLHRPTPDAAAPTGGTAADPFLCLAKDWTNPVIAKRNPLVADAPNLLVGGALTKRLVAEADWDYLPPVKRAQQPQASPVGSVLLAPKALPPGHSEIGQPLPLKRAQQPNHWAPAFGATQVAQQPLPDSRGDISQPVRLKYPQQPVHYAPTFGATEFALQPLPAARGDISQPVLPRKVQQPTHHFPDFGVGFPADTFLCVAKDWPNPTLRIPQTRIDPIPNHIDGLYKPVLVAYSDEGNPRGPQWRQQPELLGTPPIFSVKPIAPFRQADWPNPLLRKPQTRLEQGVKSALLSTRPAAQLDWPLPILAKRVLHPDPEQTLRLRPNETTGAVQRADETDTAFGGFTITKIRGVEMLDSTPRTGTGEERRLWRKAWKRTLS